MVLFSSFTLYISSSIDGVVELQMALAAIARRRQLLNDDVIISLAEISWEILDISGSDVSDFGLAKVAERCKALQAVDIRHELLNFVIFFFVLINMPTDALVELSKLVCFFPCCFF